VPGAVSRTATRVPRLANAPAADARRARGSPRTPPRINALARRAAGTWIAKALLSLASARARRRATPTQETDMAQTGTYNPSFKDVPDMANDAADRAHEAVERAADKVRPTINRVTESAHQAIDKLADKAMPAADWAQEKATLAQDQAQRFADQCGAMVRERPVTMLAAAAAIGYLIGRVFR
jgi:ElaB/YqjD/DUF883 family membrane-anchored ribosome-binding protein